MAKFWNFLRDDAGERVLRLDGAISDTTWFGDEVTPKIFRDDLNAGEGDITVWLNSPGGDVFAADQIFNMLKEYGNNRGLVTVKIDSLAASAATIIAMAGDAVEISPVGMMMIHNPATITAGDADEMKAAAKMLDEVKESIINAYEQKTKLPRAQLSRMMDAETWMNANKAVELGFADKIIGSENQAIDERPAASFSQRAVTNSVANAFKAKREAEKKIADAGNRPTSPASPTGFWDTPYTRRLLCRQANQVISLWRSVNSSSIELPTEAHAHSKNSANSMLAMAWSDSYSKSASTAR